jgi:hypothetical protein
MECLHQEKGPTRAALFLAFDCETVIADIAGTILPLAALPPFQEADQFLSTPTAAPGGLLIRMLFVTILRITLVYQDSMQVSQLIDSIGPADWFVIVLAEPGEPLFEQHQCPLNERLGATTSV